MSGASDISSQPGLILRTAREELGFSLDHVAHELHLRASVVQSLENEDYSAFTSDVFLKGYFRSYCRLVNLHEERMVELLEKQLLLIKQEHDDQAANVKKAAQAKVRKKAAILVVLIAVVSSALIYIFSLFGGNGNVLGTDVQSLKNSLSNVQDDNSIVRKNIEGGKSTEIGGVESGSESNSGINVSKNVTAEKEENHALTEDVVRESPDSLNVNLNESKNIDDTKPVRKSTEKFSDLPVSTLNSSADRQKEQIPSNVIHSNTVQGNVKQENVIQDSEILIKFSGDCWLKFTNGEGKTVFAALKRAGQQVKYIGRAPFSLVLGDARQSTVTFNGALVDLEPHTRKNGRAQFVLEPKS